MKHEYQPTKLNIVYLGIVLSVSAAYKLLFFGFTPYYLGYALGIMVTYAAVPLSFSLFIWFVRGKKKDGGSTTFHIILTVIVFINFMTFVREAQEKQTSIDNFPPIEVIE